MATTRYVSTTGNDGNGGTSVADAFRTIRRGLAALGTGDTLRILGGTYRMTNEGVQSLEITRPGVTVRAHDSTPVIIDGQATFRADPGNSAVLSNPAGMTEYSKLLWIKGSGVTVQDLSLRNSAGECLYCEGANATIQRIDTAWSYGAGVRFGPGADGSTASHCTVRKSNRKGTGAGITARGVSNITFSYCTFIGGAGEGISAVDRATNITFSHCTAYDGRKVMFYSDAAAGTVFDSCLVFCTGAGEFGPTQGFNITSEIYDPPFISRNITVTNCVAIGCTANLVIAGGYDYPQQFGGSKVEDPEWGFRNFKIFNNTFVDSAEGGQGNVVIWNKLAANNANNEACWFANNLIIQRNSMPIAVTTAATNYNTWTIAKNVWSKAPSSRFTGATDIVDTSGKGGTNSGATAIVLATPGDLDLDDIKLAAGSVAIDAATTAYNAQVNVTEDYFGSARPSSGRDIGAHEREGTATANNLMAGVDASPGLTITAGGSVTFSDDSTAGGAAAVERWRWEFPGGSADDINAAAPVVTYPTAGVYQANYEVWDDTLGLYSSTAVTVTVQAGGTAGASFVVGVVPFDAGDTTIAHGAAAAPDAVILYYSGASADNTAANNAVASIGMYAAGTGEQALAWTVEYNGGPSANLQWHETGRVVYDKAHDHGAAVTGIDGTNLTLAWSGSGSAGKGTAVFLSGSGINAAAVRLLEFPSGTSDAALNQVIGGGYNLAFVAGGVYHGSSGGLSWGFAAADSLTGAGTRMACGANSANRNGSEYAATRDDAVATHPNKDITVTPSFGPSSLTMTRAGGTNDAIKLVVLALNASGVEADIGVGQLPSSDVAADYATSFADVGGVLAAVTANTVANANQGDTQSLGFFAYDGTTQRSNGFYNTSGSAAVGKSYTDDALAVYDGGAAAVTTATMSDDTNEFTLTPTGADGTYFAYIAFSAAVTGIAPQADFHAAGPGTIPDNRVGKTIQFTDLSQDGSGTIDEWDWDWGDGTAHGSTQNPTHVYSAAGEYQVTLTVTDDDDETDSITKALTIIAAVPEVVWSVPETATVGDTVTVDLTGTTWPSTTIEEYNACLWQPGGIMLIGSSEEPEVAIEVTAPGAYNLGIWVEEDGTSTHFVNWPGLSSDLDENYDGVLTVYEASLLSLYSTPRTGRSVAYVGPVEIDFVLSGNRPDLTAATIDWDWGDGDDDADAGTNASHEYAGVEAAETYTITVDVEYPDGTTDQLVATDVLTLVPQFTPPIPLATLAAMWPVYQAHLGDLTGATWAREDAPNGNVWKWEASYVWAENITPRLYENGAELTARASVALCQANPGSYYATNDGGDITIYVHPSGSDNPNVNGDTYRWRD